MAILKVARMGHPVLRQEAEPVSEAELKDPDFQPLIEDMMETMDEYDGVGLAAPQVHESVRVILVQAPKIEEQDELPPLVLVNPEIEPLSSDLVSDWEGCLSIPEIRGRVPRYEGVRVTALNKEGRPVVFDAHGYLARVIQHEVDHLDGVLFLDRMEDFSSLCFLEEYGKYHRE